MYRRTRPVSRQQHEQVFGLNDEVSLQASNFALFIDCVKLGEAMCSASALRGAGYDAGAATKWDSRNRCACSLLLFLEVCR